MKDPIIKYIRDKQGTPYGTVVAIGAGQVGYTICCKHDQCFKKRGRHTAMRRAELGHEPKMRTPSKRSTKVMDAAVEMFDFSHEYFADAPRGRQ